MFMSMMPNTTDISICTTEHIEINYMNSSLPSEGPYIRAHATALEMTSEVVKCLDCWKSDVDWKTHIDACDIAFDEIAPNICHLSFPDDSSTRPPLSVSVLTASDYPALPSLIHTILSPGYAPGLIGVDYCDIKAVLCNGGQGFLTITTGGDKDAMNKALSLLIPRLNGPDNNIRIKGGLAVSFTKKEDLKLTHVRQMGNRLKRMIPNDQPITFAAAYITGNIPLLALLVVTE
jgi:hypothetical protein